MTLFEYLSSSKENKDHFSCDHTILYMLNAVYRGEECSAIYGFSRISREQCMDQVLSLKKIVLTDNQIETSKARLEKGRQKRLSMIGDDARVSQERRKQDGQ